MCEIWTSSFLGSTKHKGWECSKELTTQYLRGKQALAITGCSSGSGGSSGSDVKFEHEFIPKALEKKKAIDSEVKKMES